METAIPPELNMEKINREVASEPPEMNEDTEGKEVASLKNNPGWLQIEEYIEARLAMLKDFDVEGMSIQDIGYKYALTSGIRAELKLIIDIIDSQYEQQKGKREEGEAN